MAVALTLHRIGVPCLVLEAVPELQPLGVGINLQPNAVRELVEMGIPETALDRIGIATREWALVGRNGNDIYREPRGRLAGYRWPQYSVHRGQLQMLLYRKVLERLGADAVRVGQRVCGWREDAGRVTALVESREGRRSEVPGRLLVAADGLHSAVRAQMHPGQPPIQWGGAVQNRCRARAPVARHSSATTPADTSNSQNRPAPPSAMRSSVSSASAISTARAQRIPVEVLSSMAAVCLPSGLWRGATAELVVYAAFG